MRVLLQTYAFYPIGGGVSRSVEMLYHYLVSQGKKVRVATSSWVNLDCDNQHWIPPWVGAGISGCRRFLFSTPEKGWLSRLPWGLRFLPYLAYLLVFRPHVVHLHFVNVDAIFTLWARRFLRFRLVTTCHGSDVHVHPLQSEKRRRFFLQVLHESDRVTTVSQELKEQLLQLAPGVAVEVVPNAPPHLNESRGNPRDSLFLFAGRLSEQKNPLLLLESFALMARGRPEWKLVFAGEGALRSRLQSRIEELGLQSQVKLEGWLAAASLQRLMERAAALVLPSRRGEGCPHVLLEAMAAGAPVVAAAVGGMPELVADTGLLFESDNVHGLADCLVRLAEEPELAKELSERAHRRLVEQFHPERVFSRYLEVYQ